MLRNKIVRNFVMRLGTTDRYIENVVKSGGQFTPVSFTRLRGKAFVFPEFLKDDGSMEELHAQHLMEIVERPASA